MSNKLSNDAIVQLKKILADYPLVNDIVQAIDKAGGRALLVGGAVRDLLMNLEVKDLDIEVHGLELSRLQEILEKFGPVSLVGKAFGVLRVHGLDVDWSLPRVDSSGRHPEVIIDPFMEIQQAFARRDLTINAMGIDLISFDLIDPFNGQKDLQDKLLKATDPEFFIEDPLRFYRVMQFIGRFEMMPDESLNMICQDMDISKVSRERIEMEFEKLFLQSKRPSLGIRWLNQIHRIAECLPEIASLRHVPQNLDYHPEGDVFEHTMQALDAAAQIPCNSNQEKLYITYGALCHDIGKPITTEFVDGRWTSYRHEEAGQEIAKNLLRRITQNNELIHVVVKLVRYHMLPRQFIIEKAHPPAFKRLAKKLAPEVTMQLLAKVVLADIRGRNGKSHEPLQHDDEYVQAFLNKAQELQVSTHSEEPILHGRDLLDKVSAGPELGKLLKEAYDIQIDEGIKEKEELIRRILGKK